MKKTDNDGIFLNTSDVLMMRLKMLWSVSLQLVWKNNFIKHLVFHISFAFAELLDECLCNRRRDSSLLVCIVDNTGFLSVFDDAYLEFAS